MKILISNDDGVYAPGIAELAITLAEVAELDVVAPDRNRSGASNSLPLHQPLGVKNLDNGFISVEGTPTDCVHLALTGLLEKEFDMVVAGINDGANLGDDVLYSGTVAAATEGRFLGYPSIAVSLCGETHYKTAALVAKNMIKLLKDKPMPINTTLNINVPDVPYADLKGFELTRLGTRHCAEPTIKQVDPRGGTIYWVGPPGIQRDAGSGTDFYAISHNVVSITPLHFDLTHYTAVEEIKDWSSELELV